MNKTFKCIKPKEKESCMFVAQCKLQNLSKRKIKLLNRLFLEAKQLYNQLIADTSRLNLSISKIKVVYIKVNNNFEKRELNIIGSQLKQAIRDKIKYSLKSLERMKQKGYKTGKLHFRSEINSIILKQYGITYKIDKARNRIFIQKIGSFRVLGLHQINNSFKIGNANLIKKPNGFYLNILCYKPFVSKAIFNKPISLDFGIRNKLTFSNGIKIDYGVPETKRLKRLYSILSKKVVGSKNYFKIKKLINIEQLKIYKKKKEIHNKIISFLKKYSIVIYQNDNISKWWKQKFKKKIYESLLGNIISRLRNGFKGNVVSINRFQLTSKLCFVCDTTINLSLSEKIFYCPNCGYKEDRDLNATKIMLKKVFNSLDNKWFEISDEEVNLIKKLFYNIRYYISIFGIDNMPYRWTDGKLCPEKGKPPIGGGSHAL